MSSTNSRELTQAILKEYLHYCPITGNFTRLKLHNKPGGLKIGDLAGSNNGRGYLKINLLGSRYYAHRLAFLYMEGEIPELIDHINRDKSDNSWANLRKATKEQNLYNRPVDKRNTTGVKNVRWSTRYSAYEVTFTVNRKSVFLGRYKDLEVASKIAKEFRQAIHKDFACH